MSQPFSYRAASRPENVNFRLFKYVFSVTCFSGIINISRFFETEFVTKSINVTMDDSVYESTKLGFDVTPLRRDPNYIR